MNNTNIILVLVVLTNLKLLGSSRLGASIRVVAMQGVVLGLLPVLAHTNELSVRFAVLAAGTIALKGIVFPWFLFRAVREAEVTREVEPYVGYVTSLLAGVLMVLASACDMLDGAVARIGNKKTTFGAFLDSTLDRFSDFVVYAGIAVYYAAASPANVTYCLLAMLAFFNSFFFIGYLIEMFNFTLIFF